jgi:hypothetical protein
MIVRMLDSQKEIQAWSENEQKIRSDWVRVTDQQKQILLPKGFEMETQTLTEWAKQKKIEKDTETMTEWVKQKKIDNENDFQTDFEREEETNCEHQKDSEWTTEWEKESGIVSRRGIDYTPSMETETMSVPVLRTTKAWEMEAELEETYTSRPSIVLPLPDQIPRYKRKTNIPSSRVGFRIPRPIQKPIQKQPQSLMSRWLPNVWKSD